jgi:membrane protein implicated in regulation of membrane protease activity
MSLNAATLWWVVAGVLVAVELASGTFYLLMLAVGAAAAAVAAYLGIGLAGQLLGAAIVGGGAVVAWHLKRACAPAPLPAGANRDVNLDIGELVQVDQWGADGSARVTHRGASWQARHAGGGTPAPGAHVIRALEGNILLLERAPH